MTFFYHLLGFLAGAAAADRAHIKQPELVMDMSFLTGMGTGTGAGSGMPVTPVPNIMSVPFQLRANDIAKHIVNIDSRFRLSPAQTSAGDFYYQLNPPIKNVLRIRLTSIEFPNNYPFFTACRQNTTFTILYTLGGAPRTATVTIPDGNYDTGEMATALTTAINTAVTGLAVGVSFDATTGRFTFSSTSYFALDMGGAAVGVPVGATVGSRVFDYGLGYYLGFTKGVHQPTRLGGSYVVTSDSCANLAGDNYLFLRVNDYNCVRHNTGDTEVLALAKLLLREPKNYMAYDDYSGEHAKEVVFPSPQNLSRLHIQVLDAYGLPIDMCAANFSFSMEVLEIKNSTLYNTVRDSLGVNYM